MSARLTVVFDDEDLYRRLKVRAAEDGVPLKRLVEDALKSYLDAGHDKPERWTTGADMLAVMEEMRALDDDPDGPALDYSDIKHHLYGYPKQREPDWAAFVDRLERRVAEERAPYDAHQGQRS